MKKLSFKNMTFSDIPDLIKSLFKANKNDDVMMTGQTGKYEVNLVPDVKLEMLKMQKMRNLVFFVCMVVVIASVSTVALLGGVKGAQDLMISGQENHIKNLSDKVTTYKELPDFLTIQDQLKKLSEINKNRPVLSRVFPILKNLFPTGADTIKMSELNVNLESATLNFDAQANAGEDPKIDYRVLESFKKSVNMTKYDFGRYVTANGEPIPTRCIRETDENGNLLSDNGSVYAIWKRGVTDCDPGRNDHAATETEEENKVTGDKKIDSSVTNTDLKNGQIGQVGEQSGEEPKKKTVTKVETVIPDEKIWRTPQFETWSKGEEVKTSEDGVADDLKSSSETKTTTENGVDTDTTTIKNVKNFVYKPGMNLKGKITSIPHFESECIKYTGQEATEGDKKVIKWSAQNNCKMVPEGTQITDSSNGRDANNNLVLRFSAVLAIDPVIFAYNTKHVMTIGPTGQNVTDSYQQIKGMFAAKAKDCRADDAECINTSTKQTDSTNKGNEGKK